MPFKKLLTVFSLLTIVSTYPAIADMVNEPDGFRGIKWGDPLSKHRHEMKEYRDNQRGQVEESYLRINDDLHYGGTKLKDIIYTFYKDKFQSVVLTSSDSRDKEVLLNYLRKQYGSGFPVNVTNQYTNTIMKWQGKQVTIQFLYTPQSGYSNIQIENDEVLKEDVPASFRGLDWYPLGGHPVVGKIGIWYVKKNSTILNKTDNDEFPSTTVMKTRIDARTKDEYTVAYSEGPSFDPSFAILKVTPGGNKLMASFSGTNLYIPGTGDVYVSNRSNVMFEQRNKYHLSGDKLELVKQPMLYVGIKTKANKQFTIYSDTDSKSPVAVLPAGTDIEVLVADKGSYLIKTPFGLIGWYSPNQGFNLDDRFDSPIPELFFAGD